MAMQQAELMEKEKQIMEQQQKVQRLKATLQNMVNHQVALERERRRCDITQQELGSVDDSRPVYKSLGRFFVSSSVPTLKEDFTRHGSECGSEINRLTEEKKKLAAAVQKEDEILKTLANEFVATMEQVRAAQKQ